MSKELVFSKPPYHPNWSLLLLIFALVVFTGTIIYYYGDQIRSTLLGAEDDTQVVEGREDGESAKLADFPYNATGTLTFTAANPEFLPDEYVMGNYQIDVSEPESGYTDLFPFTGINNMYFIDEQLQNGFVVYGDRQRLEDNPELSEEDLVGIGRFNVVDQDRPEFSIEPLSFSGWYERHLSYSPEQNKLVYITTEQPIEELNSFQDIGNWGINTYDLETHTHSIVATGTSPVWYGDTNSFFFIHPDGIKFYNNELGEVFLVSEVHDGLLENRGSESYSFNNRLAISPDGSNLLLTSPVENAIHFYTIENESLAEEQRVFLTHRGTHEANIGIGHYEPIISPDGNYFAVVKTAFSAPRFETVETMQISIGSVEHQVILHSIDISDFTFESIFIDSWQ